MFGPLVPGTIGNGGGIPCIKHARTSVGLLIKLYPVSQIQYLFGLLRRLNIVGYQFIPFISRRQEDIKSRICFGNSSRNRRRKPAAFMDCLLLKYFYIFVTKMSLASVSSVATALTFKVFIDIPCFVNSFHQSSRHLLYSAFLGAGSFQMPIPQFRSPR